MINKKGQSDNILDPPPLFIASSFSCSRLHILLVGNIPGRPTGFIFDLPQIPFSGIVTLPRTIGRQVGMPNITLSNRTIPPNPATRLTDYLPRFLLIDTGTRVSVGC